MSYTDVLEEEEGEKIDDKGKQRPSKFKKRKTMNHRQEFNLHDVKRTGKNFLEIIPCLLMISMRVNFRNLGTMKKMKRIGDRFHKEACLQEGEHPNKMVLDE